MSDGRPVKVDIRKYLEEGKEHIRRNDPVQASEKLYKAAEEAVKVISETFAPELREEAMRKGRWTTTLLFKAVERAADRVGEEIIHHWDTAWTLHVEGFHEARLDINSVTRRVKQIEALIRLAEGKR